jgi:pyruvate formate lyase activating enzyme
VTPAGRLGAPAGDPAGDNPADGDSVRCDFCAWNCSIAPGGIGRCGARENRGGAVVSRFPGEIIGPHIDPVEKKPLYHYYPGSDTYSIAQFGCNFTCDFCQNYHLVDPAMRTPASYRIPATHRLLEGWRAAGCPTVAFTYSEPAVWQDLLIGFSAAVRAESGRCAVVSNGYWGRRTIDRMMESAEAFNIDFKGSDDFYRRRTGGRQAPVLQTITALAASEDHVLEVTTLVIESEHSRDEILRMAGQLSDAGVRVWHLSLFYPAYRMADIPPTSAAFALDLLKDIRTESDIPHLYLGNARGSRWSDTRCAGCGGILVRRDGYRVSAVDLADGCCPDCGMALYGRFP